MDNRNPRAADSNQGAKELPFLIINKAAQVLQAGQRVVIMRGVYRARVAVDGKFMSAFVRAQKPRSS